MDLVPSPSNPLQFAAYAPDDLPEVPGAEPTRRGVLVFAGRAPGPLHDVPVPLAQARPGATPPRLQEILDKAMAKEPRDRYQRVTELRDDLKAVLREVSPGAVSQFDEVTPLMAPRHLGGKGSDGARPALVQKRNAQ